TNGLTMVIKAGLPSLPPQPTTLSAFFAASDSDAGQATTFEGAGSGGKPPYSYSWNFGDSTFGAGQTTMHTYPADGIYTVTLTVTDSLGTTAQFSQEITVNPGLTITVNTANPTHGSPVSFTATAAGDTTYTFAWDFGDGTGRVSGGTTNPNNIS